jgi:adenylate cyclase
VRALTTRASYALALEQGYRPRQPPEMRAAREVQGVTGPIDLVVLAS